MPEYIKVTYDDGEIWRARKDPYGGYCSDDVMLCVSSTSSGYELAPGTFIRDSYEKLKQENKVEIITKEEYEHYVNEKLVGVVDDEITTIRKQLAEKIKERKILLGSVARC